MVERARPKYKGERAKQRRELNKINPEQSTQGQTKRSIWAFGVFVGLSPESLLVACSLTIAPECSCYSDRANRDMRLERTRCRGIIYYY